MKLLVIFNKNWADECDVHGWAIMSPEDYEKLKDFLPRLTYNFGTNEGWEEPGEFEERDFTVHQIGDREEDFLRTTFKPYDNQWGNFPYWEDALYEEEKVVLGLTKA